MDKIDKLLNNLSYMHKAPKSTDSNWKSSPTNNIAGRLPKKDLGKMPLLAVCLVHYATR